ncbi:hypothetical protein KKG71_05815 [Patescibacteria group bacterium]|nr:hypothetical protein [Patescibacteria group bacterium]
MDILINIAVVLLSIFILLLGITFLMGVLSAGPFIPTTGRAIEKFASLITLNKKSRVFDLGCGDGRLLRYIERKYGVIGEGYEIAPLVYLWAKIYSKLVGSKVKIYCRDLFKADLSKADVIFLYLVPFVLKKLGKKMNAECRKGTIIISEGFTLPNLKLKKHIPLNKKKGLPSFYIYEI